MKERTDTQRGSIELARTICEELEGELPNGEQYGSVDVAEILSAHVRNLEGQLEKSGNNPTNIPLNHDSLLDQGLRVAHSRMEKAEREATHLRMQIGYIVAELQAAGDKRSTPEIVETAAQACA